MAKGFSFVFKGMAGKIGGIVLTEDADGATIMRSKAATVRQPNTDVQQQQKSRFGVMVKLAAINKVILRSYTKRKKPTVSPYASFLSTNVIGATTLSQNVASIDYKKIVTVSGGGADPYQLQLGVSTPGSVANSDEVSLTWTYNVANPTHNVTDTVGIVVITPQYDVIAVTVSPAAITTNSAVFDVLWPNTGDLFVIPFYMSGVSGYGAELNNAVQLPSTGTGTIISRA